MQLIQTYCLKFVPRTCRFIYLNNSYAHSLYKPTGKLAVSDTAHYGKSVIKSGRWVKTCN